MSLGQSPLTASMPEFSRNLGFLSDGEQQRINDSTVAIAGAGGDGGMLAVELARLGVGRIKLADPEHFEAENINRQEGCYSDTLGVNKAEAVAANITRINPGIEIELFTDGIQTDNIGDFARGADLIVDETEFTRPELGVMIAREARRLGKPVLMALNIGFGGQVTSYGPNGKTFEQLMGLDPEATLDEIAQCQVPLSRWIARLPNYVDLDVFKKVATGEMSAPSIIQGVGMASSMAATEAVKHLAPSKNRGEPVWAPKTFVMDPHDRVAKVINHPRLSHNLSLARVLVMNKLGKAPKAGTVSA